MKRGRGFNRHGAADPLVSLFAALRRISRMQIYKYLYFSTCLFSLQGLGFFKIQFPGLGH